MNISRRRFFTTTCGAVLAGLAGCQSNDGNAGEQGEDSTPPPLGELEISIFDVRTPSVGARSATVPVLLEFVNTADRPIPSPSGELDVYINDQQVVTSEPSLNTLEPGETATATEEIIVRFGDVGGGLASALANGQFELRLVGTIRSEDATETVELSHSYP